MWPIPTGVRVDNKNFNTNPIIFVPSLLPLLSSVIFLIVSPDQCHVRFSSPYQGAIIYEHQMPHCVRTIPCSQRELCARLSFSDFAWIPVGALLPHTKPWWMLSPFKYTRTDQTAPSLCKCFHFSNQRRWHSIWLKPDKKTNAKKTRSSWISAKSLLFPPGRITGIYEPCLVLHSLGVCEKEWDSERMRERAQATELVESSGSDFSRVLSHSYSSG